MKITVRELNAAWNLMQLPRLKAQFSTKVDQLLIEEIKWIIDEMLLKKKQEIDLPDRFDHVLNYVEELANMSEDMHKQKLFTNNRR